MGESVFVPPTAEDCGHHIPACFLEVILREFSIDNNEVCLITFCFVVALYESKQMNMKNVLAALYLRKPEIAANRRNFSKYTIDEIKTITQFGRSTDPKNPLARQTADELLWLINEHLLTLNPARILEIGIASGGTTLILCSIFPQARVFGIDLTDALLPDPLRKHPAFTMVIGNSNDTATRDLLVSGCAEFDFILIDGDHSEQGVLKDAELYLPLLRVGGMAVFHDVCLDPPKGIKPTWSNRLKAMLPGSGEFFVDPNNNGYGFWYKQ